MKTFLLDHEQLAVLLNFVHADSIPGVKVELPVVDEPLVAKCKKSLAKAGLLENADQPGAVHLADGLMAAMTALAVPDQLVLIRDDSTPKTMQFSLTNQDAVAIELGRDQILLTTFERVSQMGTKVINFMPKNAGGLIAVALWSNDTLNGMSKATITGSELLVEDKPRPFDALQVTQFLEQYVFAKSIRLNR